MFVRVLLLEKSLLAFIRVLLLDLEFLKRARAFTSVCAC